PRAGALPQRLRRLPARGSRPRHQRRGRIADDVPVRPAAVGLRGFLRIPWAGIVTAAVAWYASAALVLAAMNNGLAILPVGKGFWTGDSFSFGQRRLRHAHAAREAMPDGVGTEQHAIETILLEERRYPPREGFASQANAQPDIYDRDFDEFWEIEGRERVTWFEPFQKLYEWEPPYAKWYVGGQLNVCFNCVDRHVEAGNGGKIAYYWEGEPEDDRREVTFADLQGEIVRFANG